MWQNLFTRSQKYLNVDPEFKAFADDKPELINSVPLNDDFWIAPNSKHLQTTN